MKGKIEVGDETDGTDQMRLRRVVSQARSGSNRARGSEPIENRERRGHNRAREGAQRKHREHREHDDGGERQGRIRAATSTTCASHVFTYIHV